MKRKISIFILLIITIILSGCTLNMSPKEKTIEFLDKYINNDSEIMKEVDDYLKTQDLKDEQRMRYKNIIKEEYSTLKYDIKKETIKDDEASVEVDINVTDLYSASQRANDDLLDNPSDFYVDGIYSSEIFIDHKLDIMEETKEKVSYTVTFNYKKIDGKWELQQLTDESLEKIHGIYKY